jgi:hypothetical protein
MAALCLHGYVPVILPFSTVNSCPPSCRAGAELVSGIRNSRSCPRAKARRKPRFGGGNWGRWSRPQGTLGTIALPQCLLPPGLTPLDRTRQGCAPGLSGFHSQATEAGGFMSVRPFGSVRSSMRVDPLITHQVCIRLTTTRSQNWGKRAHLTHGIRTERPDLFSVAPSSPVRP